VGGLVVRFRKDFKSIIPKNEENNASGTKERYGNVIIWTMPSNKE
jgi:hypothetical protein